MRRIFCPDCGSLASSIDKKTNVLFVCPTCKKFFDISKRIYDNITPPPAISSHAKLLAVIAILAAVCFAIFIVCCRYAFLAQSKYVENNQVENTTLVEPVIEQVKEPMLEVIEMPPIVEVDIPKVSSPIQQETIVYESNNSIVKVEETIPVSVVETQKQEQIVVQGYNKDYYPYYPAPIHQVVKTNMQQGPFVDDLYSMSQSSLLALAKQGKISPLEYRDIVQWKREQYRKIDNAQRRPKRVSSYIFVGSLSAGSRPQIPRGIPVPPRP